jgi:hypothetical protein
MDDEHRPCDCSSHSVAVADAAGQMANFHAAKGDGLPTITPRLMPSGDRSISFRTKFKRRMM